MFKMLAWIFYAECSKTGEGEKLSLLENKAFVLGAVYR
jgi:hypothetical protein